MKKLSIICSLFVAAMAMNSCDTLPVDIPVDPEKGSLKVALNANIDGYTRATDTAFEAGDAIGLYILTPTVYLDNGKFTLTNGEWTPAETYYWYETDSLTSTVVGYYPYQAKQDFAEGTISFTVNADQSTHALYTASDLMLATTQATPTENKIALPFSHALSKVIVSIDNQTTEEIAEVYFANVYGAATVNLLNGKAEYVGSKGSIKAAAATLATGANVWTLILVPQTAKPQLIVTTASQKQYTFDLDEEVVFAPSKQCNAAITISPESKATGFTTTITDWTSDNDLNFHQEDVPEWKSIGTGKYLEDALVNVFPGVQPYEIDVEIEENIATPGRYRIVTPYQADMWGAEEPNYVIINTTTGNPYIEESNTGYYYNDDYGYFHIASLCPENGYNYSYYGGYIAEGVLRFNSYSAAIVSSGNNKILCGSTIHTITLPGYTRPAMYGFDNMTYVDAATDDSGAAVAKLSIISRFDNEVVKLAVLEGVVYSSDIEGVVDELVSGTIASQDAGFKGKGTFEVAVPLAQSGVYTAVIYTLDAQNQPYYFFRQFGYTVDGEELPKCDLTMGDVTTAEAHPDSQLTCNIKCSDALVLRTAAIESSAIKADTMSVEQLTEFIMANGTGIGTNSVRQQLGSDNGYNAVFAGLKADTDYTLLAYVSTLYNVEGVVYKTGRTGAAIEWVTLEGTGTFSDVTQFFGGWDSYRSNVVEIQQAANGAEHFRVLRPYANYWASATDLSRYAGSSAEYLEFYVAQPTDSISYLYFNPFRTGYLEDLNGEYHELVPKYQASYSADLSIWATARYNIKKAEGVYQLAPWYQLEGTNYGYGYNVSHEVIIITLPGYTYEFERDQQTTEAPALAPAKRTMESLPTLKRNRAAEIGRPTARMVVAETDLVEAVL